MIIGIDIASWFEPGSSIGRSLGHLVRALAAVGPEHEYLLLAPDTMRPGRRRTFNREALEGVPASTRFQVAVGAVPGPLCRVGNGRWLSLWRTRCLDRRGVDAAFFFHPTLTTFVPSAADFATVVAVHDLIPIRFPAFTKPQALERAQRLLRVQAGSADLLLAVSETTKQAIIDELGVPAERVHVLYQGIAEGFRPRPEIDRGAVCERLQLPREFILFVGRLDPWKNVNALLGAFRLLCSREDFRYDLVLAGPRDWGYPALETAVSEWNLGDRIHFQGYVPDEDLPLLYNLARCFVFPSWYEGFGLPVLEAMASGCPVVTSTAPALREAAGGAAQEADPADEEALARAISKTLSEPELREEMTQHGLKRATEFTWERTARQLLDELSALVGSRRPG